MIGREASRTESAGKGGREPRWRVAVVCLVLAAITFAVFGQTLTHGFVDYDDRDYVYDNPRVAGGLTFKGIMRAFTYIHSANWHPLTWISHMVDCQLYGLHPGGHHLTNVLLHTATVIALFLVLRQMTGAYWRSAFVAAVFAIHPLRVESVAWVAERKDVLSGLFFMLTIGAYVRYVRLPSSVIRYGTVLLLFALGLMCKPMLVTLPLVLLLLDYWPLRREESPKKLLMEKVPLLAFSAASCVVTLLAQSEAIQSTDSSSMLLRCANALVSCAVYLRQMVWPAGLAVLYPFPFDGLPALEVALGGALLAGVSVVAWGARRTQPWLLMGWLWYLVMLLPVVGIIQAGVQAHADRYTYLPQIGIYVAVTWLAADRSSKCQLGRTVLKSLIAAVIALLMAFAWKQTTYWQSSETLWPHTIACTKDNQVAYYNLGTVFLDKGRLDDAISCFKNAVRIEPNYQIALNNLGSALFRKGQLDEAIAHFQKALQIRPNYATGHNNLGDALLQKGDVEGATAQYEETLRINPNYAAARYSLGNILLHEGKGEEAIPYLQKALQLKPGYAAAHYDLGLVFLQMGRVDDGISQLQEALQTDPGHAEAHVNLGIVLIQKGKLDEAISHLQRALQIDPDQAQAQDNLGYALLQKGEVEEAIAHLRKALEINPAFGNAHNILGNALLAKGNVAEAIAQFQQGLQLEPADTGMLNNLAWLLAACPEASLRNGPKAVELAQKASDLTGGKNPVILHTLAAALAEAGRFSEAVKTAQKAMRLAEAQSNTPLVAQLQIELKLYQADKAFHIPEQTSIKKK